MKKELHSDVLDRIVYDLASSIDSPRSLAVWLCYKYSQSELIKLPMTDPADNDTARFAADYAITEYLQKYKGLRTGLDLEAVALEKWFASEDQCRAANSRFQNELRGFTPRASALLFKAQRKIAQILGDRKDEVWQAECRWATGATFDIPKRDAAPDNKMTRPLSVTDRALPYLRRVLEHDPHWFASLTGVIPDGEYCVLPPLFKRVRGSRFLTVPKSAKTNRCIAAEPTGNGFLQKGVHSYMRRRLKRFGVDLDNQAKNQELAAMAYAHDYATLDLSAASDTISQSIVWHLLPIDWACLLDDLRSPSTRVKNEWIKTEKFASMGNAFCFELETLIFYALARAVCGEDVDVAVYGDDIIVPSRFAPELIELLELCGFSINKSKSYVVGNFFESCGKHYHRGLEVTPAYQKEVLADLSEVIRAHNRLLRFGHRARSPLTVKTVKKISKWVIASHQPAPLIPFGVQRDDGFLVDPLRLLTTYDKNHGFRCQVLSEQHRYTDVTSESALYAYKLYNPAYQNARADGKSGNIVPRRARLKRVWVAESDIDLDFLRL